MNKLILNPEFNLYERKGQAYCSSRQVAETFKRQHKHVLDTIYGLTEPTSGLSEEFRFLNFQESSYKDVSGKRNKEFLLTKDGFAITVMEFKTAKAREFKEAYIKRFNDMEAFIKSLMATKMEFPAFTLAVMEAHEEPKHYHYSNEINMIYRIVLGMDAKKFRMANGLEDGVGIRPYLSTEQIKAIESLQRIDIGLFVARMDFQQRKDTLTRYLEQRRLTA
jgi:Rha family phage regulatory protein